jgi:hypothetical protein
MEYRGGCRLPVPKGCGVRGQDEKDTGIVLSFVAYGGGVVIVIKNGCCVVGASQQAVEKNTSRNEVTREYDDGQKTGCLMICKSRIK